MSYSCGLYVAADEHDALKNEERNAELEIHQWKLLLRRSVSADTVMIFGMMEA